MAGNTTRLNLYKPGGGSSGLYPPDETVDIDKINTNMDKLDTAVGAFLCTSVTHPATPFDGQFIKETDTGKLLIWRQAGGIYVDASPGIIPIGTAAQRDTYWGVPASQAARITLANLVPRWFNTDRGIQERYFAQTADAVVTPGTPVREIAGWKPDGFGKVPIIPTVISGTGVTVSPNGLIIIAGGVDTVPAILDFIFSTDFTEYEYDFTIDSSSVAVDLGIQFRDTAGSIQATGYNTSAIGSTAGAAVTNGYTPANTYMPLARSNGADGGWGNGKISIAGPLRTAKMTGMSIDTAATARSNFVFHNAPGVARRGMKMVFTVATTGLNATLRFWGCSK